MLFAKPTPKGTGAEFWGDYVDLSYLYETIDKLYCYHQNEYWHLQRNYHIIMTIKLEVLNALQNKSMKKEEEDAVYYGFRLDWITLLYCISSLRYNAGRTSTDELDQCNLMLLEYWTLQALNKYDPIGTRFIKLFINRGIHVADEKVGQKHHCLLVQYLLQKPGKKRFRSIPNLLAQDVNKTILEYCITEDVIPDSYSDYDIVW